MPDSIKERIMANQSILQSQQFAQPLAAGKALSLRTRRATALVVVQGRVWATVDGQPVDHVLEAGDQLTLCAGQRVVVEAWGYPGLTGAGADASVAWVAPAQCVRKASYAGRLVAALRGVFSVPREVLAN
jgi:hypothetical protein